MLNEWRCYEGNAGLGWQRGFPLFSLDRFISFCFPKKLEAFYGNLHGQPPGYLQDDREILISNKV